MKTHKRMLSLALVLTLVLTMLPVLHMPAKAQAENLARSATASAINSHSQYPASKVNDGSSGGDNRWSTAEGKLGDGIWVQLSWDAPVTFDHIKLIEWENLRANDFQVAISDDGQAFTPIHTGKGIGTDCNLELDKTYTAKHLRLTMTSVLEPQMEAPCISEIEVYRLSNDAAIRDFTFMGNKGTIDHEKGTISFQVGDNVDLTKLEPEIQIPKGATIAPTGAQDFTNPVTYTVTAKDGQTTKEYVATAVVKKYLTDSDLSDTKAEDVAPFGAIPTPYQYQYQREELAAFLHFGMNTFTGSEWGDGKESPSQFTLTEKVDADNYVRTLKEAGFHKVVVTAKHHDGFCIWDSKWTKHDTASTGYPGGDVLADISAACSKYDMDMGLYLSPWDVNSEYYGYRDENGNPTTPDKDVLDYDEYYDGQLREILGNDKYGNKGKFVEVWMDGAKGDGSFAQEYDFDRYLATIRELEGTAAGRIDDPLLFGCGIHTNTRWIGNEGGYANEETWAKAQRTYDENGNPTALDNGPTVVYMGNKTSKGVKNGNFWSVPEVDARITSGWFWGANKATPKSLNDLRDMYVHSVGHNAPLLLNVPLNTSGTLDEAIRRRVEDWGKNVRRSFHENNLLEMPGVTISASDVQDKDIRFKPSNVADNDDKTYWTATQGTKEASLIVDFGKEITFDALTLEEEILHGQRVEAFSVYYKSGSGDWVEYESGTTIGGKRVILGKPARTSQVKISFSGMTDKGVTATPVISHVGVYKVTSAFQLGNGSPEGMSVLDSATSAFKSGSWKTVTDRNALGGSYLEGTDQSGALSVTFTGTRAWIMGYPQETTLEVTVDDGPAKQVQVAQGGKNIACLFETEDLSDGSHTITIKALSGTAKIDALYALNNGGKGLLEFEHDSYTVDEDMWFEVKVIRKGGSVGTLSALVQDNPGSAVQSSYVPTEGIRVDFADGETEKTVRIRTKRYTETTGTLSFTLELVPVSDGEHLAVGLRMPARVNIIDAESYTGGYLQGIKVSKAPDRTTYELGQKLDTTGMVVEGIYNSQPEHNKVTAGNGLGDKKEIRLDQPITTSNLRLTLLSVLAGQTDAPCISEIEIYNGQDKTNLAKTATPSAISQHSEKYGPARLIDGQHTGDNRWSAANCVVANGALPAWVQLDWEKEITFDTIVIYEWQGQSRADGWSLDMVKPTTVTRVMDETQYEISPSEAFGTLGETTITVTAKEDGSMTDTFKVNVVEKIPTAFAVKVEKTAHGTVTVDPQKAEPESTVTITATPEAKYMVDGVRVTDLNGTEIQVTKQSNGTYTFVMPNGEVTVAVTFKLEENVPTEPAKPTDPTKPATPGNPDTPKTGDTGNVMLWGLLVMVSGAGAIALMLDKKRAMKR